MIISRDHLFNVVCNIRTPKSGGKISVGTGSFIIKENKVYLLTATHVAQTVDDTTVLAFGKNKSNCVVLPLKDLSNGYSWKYHSVADMAVIELNILGHLQLFQERCFPYDHINISDTPASRDDELTVIGFPNGLGVQGKFSPLTFRSYASSAFLTLPRADTHTLSDFFCLENPSVGGYSGGPVFDMGYEKMGCATATKEKTLLHGIVHGTMSDETGGKIALITPMFYLKDLI